MLITVLVTVCVCILDVLVVIILVLVPGLLVLPCLVSRRAAAGFGGFVVAVRVALVVIVALRVASVAVVGMAPVTFCVVEFAVCVSVGTVPLCIVALVIVSCFVVIAPVFLIIRPLYLVGVAMARSMMTRPMMVRTMMTRSIMIVVIDRIFGCPDFLHIRHILVGRLDALHEEFAAGLVPRPGFPSSSSYLFEHIFDLPGDLKARWWLRRENNQDCENWKFLKNPKKPDMFLVKQYVTQEKLGQ